VVHVLETSPPLDAQPVEWFLLTTCEITTTEQAQECLRWYCLRWRIEDWHRVLKSGCRIEVRISANVTGDFGNVTDPGLGAGLRG